MSLFIVIEGLDGAGTTTQAERLCVRLAARGHPTVSTREPSDGPVGRIIRDTLRRRPGAPLPATLPYLFVADRSDHLNRTVEPALASRKVVVSDRYYHSSLAYQSLELPLERVHALNSDFRTPDLTIFLEVPVEECLARITSRGEETGEEREIFEERERLTRIAAAYEATITRLEEAGEPILRLDGTRGIEELAREILAAVLARVPA